jgi:hypothetical protein
VTLTDFGIAKSVNVTELQVTKFVTAAERLDTVLSVANTFRRFNTT